MPDNTASALSPLLPGVKEALRRKTDAFNGEIEDLIAACRTDLKIAGVSEERADSDDDPMIILAVKLYCKANFGYIEDAERFQKSYDSLKTQLSLAGDYH